MTAPTDAELWAHFIVRAWAPLDATHGMPVHEARLAAQRADAMLAEYRKRPFNDGEDESEDEDIVHGDEVTWPDIWPGVAHLSGKRTSNIDEITCTLCLREIAKLATSKAEHHQRVAEERVDAVDRAEAAEATLQSRGRLLLETLGALVQLNRALAYLREHGQPAQGGESKGNMLDIRDKINRANRAITRVQDHLGFEYRDP